MIDKIKLSIKKIPFNNVLSFLPLIKELKIKAKKSGIVGVQAQTLLDVVEKYPELAQEPFSLDLIDKYQEPIEQLMSFFFTPFQIEEEMAGVSNPFDDCDLYVTSKFKQILSDENFELEILGEKMNDNCYEVFTKLIYAYSSILSTFYDFELDMNYLFTYKITDKRNGIEKYFKLEFYDSYIELSHKGELPKVSKKQIHEMINNPSNMDYWLKTLPIDQFVIKGFMPFRYIDVTQIQVISSLKSQLIEKSAIINKNNFKALKQSMRSLLGMPNLDVGLIAMELNQGKVKNSIDLWHGFLAADKFDCDAYRNTIYEDAGRKGIPVLVSDLTQKKDLQVVEQALLDKGIKNIIIVPLYYNDSLVGMMELGSPKAYDLTFSKLRIIKDIIPVFSIAVQRSSEELKNKIEATIKEECTAIHPSVEWRFLEAASDLLIKRESGENAQMEEIVFPEVYPLYGAIDIRHSSVIRNQTIQEDLIEQLDLAKQVLDLVYQKKFMPIYAQLIFKMDSYIEGIQQGLSTGDEVNVLHFLRKDIEPLFSHFYEEDENIQVLVDNYYKNINSELNIVYKRRKDFEDSLAVINDCVSSYLEKEEEEAQKMFPHYFEKYRTDGLEHNIYVGQSIADGLDFDLIYLKNLRLWQLIVSAELMMRTHALKKILPIPLDTTGLILVHSQPLSIRFRHDEKKFDVDGAYNIRYEIVKKRIDKALINGTTERLTQPGKLAIIFAQKTDMFEYRRYLEYLISENYFEDDIEELDLEDLQGVYGLKAFRVQVTKERKEIDTIQLAEKYMSRN
jgi:hypothetical protein